ncbi:MAG TPA: hypothetical protein VMI11_14470 [Actinomycetes bacterium]|nr:hypothetical protein [Actinomycetes bacterium]
MSVGWVAGSVRSRAMTRRRLGREGARDLAALPSLDAALFTLAGSAYGRGVSPGQTLAAAQRGVVDTTLWNLRVLAGWVPRDGVAILRLLVGGLEIANLERHLARLGEGATVRPLGGPPAREEPYQLGGLATAWPRLATTSSPGEVRAVLAASPWGDPGGESPREIGLAMRLSLADRVMAAVPAAAGWAAGAAALLVAREVLLAGLALPAAAAVSAARVLGHRAVATTTLADLTAALPSATRWALAGVGEPTEIWRAETRWWAHVDHEAGLRSRAGDAGPEALVAAVGMLAADAWRVRAALEIAARGGVEGAAYDVIGAEAFDAVA